MKKEKWNQSNHIGASYRYNLGMELISTLSQSLAFIWKRTAQENHPRKYKKLLFLIKKIKTIFVQNKNIFKRSISKK